MPIGGAISALCATVTDIGCCQEEERMGERERERERESIGPPCDRRTPIVVSGPAAAVRVSDIDGRH